MKNLISLCFSILLVINSSTSLVAQSGIDQMVSREKTEVIIDSIGKLVEHYYLSKKIGKNTRTYLKKQHADGNYYNLSYRNLGRRLTKDLREISGDIHMAAFYHPKKGEVNESLLANKLDKSGSMSNFGYTEAKVLDGNIGYLKIAHFTKWRFFEDAKKAASNAVQLVQNTDALIVDLRNNPGGFEDIVAYLVSYFFDDSSIKLQTYYCRYQNSRSHIQTTQVPGKRLVKQPVYILVNKRTGSAAESFAYIMKHLGRATLIGETTAGAGNGAASFRVSNEFSVQIAVCETINAVTKTSWEKTGVIPHLKMESKAALSKAMELAQISSKAHRTQVIQNDEKLLNNMDSTIQHYRAESSDKALLNSIIACQQAGLLTESMINRMGYKFLRQENTSLLAEVILKANTVLYPNSSNVYDSYADALTKNKQLEKAVQNYEKAVALARKNQESNLEAFIKHLKQAQKLIRNKK